MTDVSGSLGVDFDVGANVSGADGRFRPGDCPAASAFWFNELGVPCGTVGRFVDGAACWGTEEDGSDSSATSSTDGCVARCTTPSSNACTSWSTGLCSASIFSSSFCTAGFDALGSSPAFIAFTILKAWYLANLILAAVSSSGAFQI